MLNVDSIHLYLNVAGSEIDRQRMVTFVVWISWSLENVHFNQINLHYFVPSQNNNNNNKPIVLTGGWQTTAQPKTNYYTLYRNGSQFDLYFDLFFFSEFVIYVLNGTKAEISSDIHQNDSISIYMDMDWSLHLMAEIDVFIFSITYISYLHSLHCCAAVIDMIRVVDFLFVVALDVVEF